MRAQGPRQGAHRLFAAALVVLALVAGGCASGPLDRVADAVGLGRRIVPNDWVLLGISPDQRVLRVQTFYGGEASDCNRFVGAEIDESAERVSVRMLLSKATLPQACTDEGVTRRATVRLREPLGERDLVGCGGEPSVCRNPLNGSAEGMLEPPYRHVLVAGDVVVVSDESGVAGLSLADGTPRWRHGQTGEWASAQPLFAAHGLVHLNDHAGYLVAYDATDGAEIWRMRHDTSAWPAPDGAAEPAVVRAEGTLTAVRPRDGSPLWAREVSHTAGALAIDDDVAVLLSEAGERATQVEAFALADGTPRWSVTVPEHLEGLTVSHGTVLAHGATVRFGWNAADGAVRFRLPPFAEFGTVVSTVDSPVFLHDGEAVFFDAMTGQERRRVGLPTVQRDAVVVHDGRFLTAADDATLRVVGLDGTLRSTSPLGGLGGVPHAGGGVIAVPTHLGVSVFDEDGTLRWWALRGDAIEDATG